MMMARLSKSRANRESVAQTSRRWSRRIGSLPGDHQLGVSASLCFLILP